MDKYVRPTVPSDIPLIAQNLRPEDEAELRAASGLTPVAALSHGYEFSAPCLTMRVHEDMVGMFGVVPSETLEVGVVWLLATPLIEKHAFKFLRRSKQWADRLNTFYPVLWNVVDARNELHLKWLKWMGFQFVTELPEYGPEKRLFYEVRRT